MSYVCDVCDKPRRGAPYVSGPEGIAVCFPCTKQGEREARKAEDEWMAEMLALEQARERSAGC